MIQWYHFYYKRRFNMNYRAEVRIRNVNEEAFATMTDMAKKARLHAVAMIQVCKILRPKIQSFNQRVINKLKNIDVQGIDRRTLDTVTRNHVKAVQLRQASRHCDVIAQSDIKQFEQMKRTPRLDEPNRHDLRRQRKLQQQKAT